MIINPYPSTSLEAATLWIQAHPEQVVGLTSGTWDLFHDFHLRFLLRCRRVCDVLIVGVDSDAEVRKTKGPTRPIMSEFQRLMLLDANKHVTFAYVQDGVQDFTRMAETLLSVHGGVTFRNQLFAGRESEIALGNARDKVRVVIIPDMEELNSTSALVARVALGARI